MMRRIAVAVPIPVVPFPPPAAAYFDKHPVVMHVSPLADGGSSFSDRGLTDNAAFSRRKQEGVLIAVGGDSIADDEAGIVDRLRNCEHLKVTGGKITDRVEINHLSIREEEGVHGAIGHGRESDDLAGCVASERGALIASQRSEVCHPLLGIPERVVRLRFASIRSSDGVLGGAGIGRAAGAAERPEIVHRGVRVKKGMSRTVLGLGEAHDLARGIDGVGRASRAAQRPEIDDVVA